MRLRDTLLILGVSLAALIGTFFVNFEGTPAMAQGNATSNGVIAFPVQHSAQLEAICIVDTLNKTICIYEVSVRGKTSNITLRGARDYQFDVRVREYSTSPSPDDVEKQVKEYEAKKAALKDAND